jgi:calmodulin
VKADREQLIKKRHKLIKQNAADKVKMKRQLEVSSKEVARLERLLSARYSKVIKKAFLLFDTDKSGAINPEECYNVIDALEPDMEEDKKRELCASADKDGDGEVDYEEFIALLLRRETNFDKLKEAFEAADVDNSGSIEPEELRAVLAMVEPTMTEEEVQAAIVEAPTHPCPTPKPPPKRTLPLSTSPKPPLRIGG